MKSDDDSSRISGVIKRMNGVRCAIETLCECFLVRANDTDEDPLWQRFYRIQMCSYLIAKRNLSVTPPEGDMVHDLIRDTWTDVKDYMENSKFGPVSNVEKWFRTIHIDFPVDPFDPGCTFFDGNADAQVLVMGQIDTKKPLKNLSV
ncbi:MAG: hypothetical protein IJ863_03855 [Spirochaetales bacterium]|nr:hypothetical protein [Spirochaetales bacterium]